MIKRDRRDKRRTKIMRSPFIIITTREEACNSKGRSLSSLLFLPFFLVLISSCHSVDGDIIYSRFEPIEGCVWNDTTEYFFSFPVSDTLSSYDVKGVIRLLPDFALKGLPIGVIYEDSHSENPAFHTEVLRLKVQPGSREKSSSHFLVSEISFPIEQGKHFGEQGVYTYSFRQLTDSNAIHHVAEIGLIVRKSKDKDIGD